MTRSRVPEELAQARTERWWLTTRSVASLARAGAFIDDVGFALLFPHEGVVLPTLYDAVSDLPLSTIKDYWGPDATRVWTWKDQLPRRGLAWYGRFLRGRPSFLAVRLLADLYPRAGRPDDFEDAVLSTAARRIATILLRSGPQSRAALREALGVAGRRQRDAFSAAVAELSSLLVVTHFGLEEAGAGWPTTILELTSRAFEIPCRPNPGATHLRAARWFVDTMLETRPQELARTFGWDVGRARDMLEDLVASGHAARSEQGFRSPSFGEDPIAAIGSASSGRSRSRRERGSTGPDDPHGLRENLRKEC